MNDLSPLSPNPQRFKLRVEDFDVLIESGAFAELSKVELIDGELLQMSPQQIPHSKVKTELGFRLYAALKAIESPLGALIEVSLSIPPVDAPEPDIVLTSALDGTKGVPIASTALVVEVSASTLDYDLGRKATIYGRAGIPEYWVVSIDGATIIQMTAPNDQGYGVTADIPFGTPISAVTIPGLTIDTAGL